MTVAERIDPGTLGWVQDEIEQTISQATQALDTFAANPSDPTPLRLTGNQVHQVGGTLQMVELDGGARLATETERLLDAIIKNDIEGDEAALDLVRGGLTTLGKHLDDLRLGGYHVPLKLLPTINELRAGRGADPVDPLELFTPDLSISAPAHDNPVEISDDDMPQLASDARRDYMAHLLQWLKSPAQKTSLDEMESIVDGLWAHTKMPSAAQAWWIGAGLIETFALSDKDVDGEAKMLLGRIDQRIRTFADEGESALVGDRAEDLVGRMLYEIALAEKRGARATIIHKEFDLADLLGEDSDGASVEMLRAAEAFSDEAMAEIAQARDAMTAYFDAPEPDPVQLDRLVSKMSELAEHSTQHELGAFGELIGEMSTTVAGVKDGTVAVSERLSLQLAGSLLFVENTLKGQTEARDLVEQSNAGIEGLKAVRESGADGVVGEADAAVADRALTGAELKQLLGVVAGEIHTSLRDVEESLEAYAATPDDASKLDGVHDKLGQAQGALEMLGQTRASELVSATDSVFKDLADGHLPPTGDVMDSLAFAIGGVEAYVDGIERDRPGLNRILERAMDDIESVVAQSTRPAVDAASDVTEESEGESAGESAAQSSAELADESKDTSPEESDANENQEVETASSLEVADQAETDLAPDAAQDGEADRQDTGSNAAIAAAGAGALGLMGAGVAMAADSEVPVEARVEASVDASSEVPEASADTNTDSSTEPSADDVCDELISNLDLWLADGTEVSGDSEKYQALRTSLAGVASLADTYEDTRMRQLSTEVTNLLDIVAVNPEIMSEEVDGTLRDSCVKLKNLAGEQGATAESESESEPAVAAVPAVASAAADADKPAIEESDDFDFMGEEILDIFLEEAGEVVQDIDTYHERLESNPNDNEALKEIRRSFHTLKGSGRIAGVNGLGELGWTVEELINQIIEGTALMSPAVTTLIGAARQHVGEIIQGPAPAEAEVDLGAWETAASHARRGEDPLPALIAASSESEAAQPAPTPDATSAESVTATDEEAVLGAQVDSTEDSGVTSTVALGGALAVGAAAAGVKTESTSISDAGPSDGLVSKESTLEVPDPLPSVDDIIADTRDPHDVVNDEPEPDAMVPQSPMASTGEAGADDDGELDILEIFTGEATAHLAYIGQWLGQGGESGDPRPVDDELVRAVHTLRGTSRAMDLNSIADVFEPLDNLLTSIESQHRNIEGIDSAFISRSHKLAESAITALSEGRLVNDDVDRELGLVGSEVKARLDTIRDDDLDDDTIDENASSVDQEIVSLEQASIQAEDAFNFDDFDLSEIFIEEAQEILIRFNEALDVWRTTGLTDKEHGEILRELHTIKGSARTSGFNEVADLAHNTESLIEHETLETLAANTSIVATLEEVHDALAALVQEPKSDTVKEEILALNNRILGKPEPAESSESLSESSSGRGNGSSGSQFGAGAAAGLAIGAAGLAISASPQADSTPDPVDDSTPLAQANVEVQIQESAAPVAQVQIEAEQAPEPAPELQAKEQDNKEADNNQPDNNEPDKNEPDNNEPDEDDKDQHVRVSTRHLDNLVNYAGEASVSRARVTQQFGEIHDHIRELGGNVERFRDQLRELDIQAETQMLARREFISDEDDENFDPLEFDRFSKMQTLARTLTENLEDLFMIRGELTKFAERTEDVLQQQSHIHTDLQDGLMRTRMVSVNEIVPRLRHIVRQTARDVGKQARLETTGVDVEIDRNIINRLVGPLEHMLRNAIDHGLETPEERKSVGKSDTGTIRFGCRQEGGEILIELSDDGAGLNTQAIRKKAISQELIDAEADLPDEELFQLLFKKGFSTASTLTQVSGRGVGMDVVHDSVRQLGGAVVARSKSGQGTTFTLRMPMTLAITHALVIRVGQQRFAVPLRIIKNIVKVAAADIDRLVDGDDNVFEYQGQSYPLLRLADSLAIADRATNLEKIPILLLRLGASDVAVQVDEAISTEEVVVKPLGKQLESVQGIQSATVLGDGSVVLVLEMADLFSGSRAVALVDSHQEPTHTMPMPTLPVPSLTQSDLGPSGLLGSGASSEEADVEALREIQEQLERESVDIDTDFSEVAAHSAVEVSGESTDEAASEVADDGLVAAELTTQVEPTQVEPTQVQPSVPGVAAESADTNELPSIDELLARHEEPAGEAVAAPVVAAPAIPESDEPDLDDLDPPIVMVVDDSLTVRKVTERTLGKYGFEIVLARDGLNALELLEDVKPDMMLVDIEMPRMDGFELTRQVRDTDELKHIPICIITSRAGQRHRDKAMELGATEYLSKPYQEDQLMETICAHVPHAKQFADG